MRLRVLGSSGGYPSPDNPNSGFFVEEGETRIWMDAGTGTFAQLQRIADFTRLTALLLSHVHPDHCADVYPLFVAIRYGVGGGFRLPLYAPPESREVLSHLLLEDGWEKFGEGFDVHVVDAGDEIEVGGIRVSFLRTDHPAHTLAMRLESGGRTLCYSADAGPGIDLAPFAQGCDLFVCEANYQEGKVGPPVHLTARQAAETAVRAGARALVLTHVWPTFDPRVSLEEARAVAGGLPVHWARPGETFDVGGEEGQR
jgi:ribonuclease BN (tRNA processing enzyme)